MKLREKTTPNFIGIYDNLITKDQCDEIIDYFDNVIPASEKRSGVISGQEGVVINTRHKDSLDYSEVINSPNVEISYIRSALGQGLASYREDFPDVDKISSWSIFEYFNIQKYEPMQGYHALHCEHSSHLTGSRILAWTLYLNNVTDAGHTRFPTYDLNVESKCGRVAIWPAYWTHMHHGITSKTQTKYIATGWVTFHTPLDYDEYIRSFIPKEPPVIG